MEQALLLEVNAILANKELMTFIHQEACEKVAEYRRSKGDSCTWKAISVMMHWKSKEDLKTRVKEYEAAGIMGAILAKYGK